MSIEGKIALVTGGANGIGFCTARKLLRNGAKAVALLDLGDSGGESAAAELNNEFGKDRAIFVICDVSKNEQLKESYKNVIDTYENLDIVVNIAGIMDDADWEIMVDVNYKGVVHGTILGLHTMGRYKGGNGGTIVNMSSVAGLEGIPIAPIYGGTQYAIVGFTQSLKHYYEKTGIRMLTICPGLTTTAMAARFMSTKEHAMDLLDEETAAIAMQSMQKQPPEHVASAIIQLIEKGKNGAIFVSENNLPPYAIEFPSYTTLKVPIESLPKGLTIGKMQIKDKRAIVTGAASGLGLTISRELLRNGASTIAMIDIRESAGKQAMETLNAEFGRNRAIFFRCDVTSNFEFDDTFKKAINMLGGLEILVNNAGVIDETDFTKAIDVNVTAVIRGTLLGIQQMQKDSGGKGGVIVNISSVAGLHSLSQFPVYSATKHAVVSFSRSFSQPYHYQRTGVRIIVMCPELTQPVTMENLSNNLQEEEIIQRYCGRVDSIAHGVIYVIRCAQNGSVWISEDGKPVYEIQLSDSLPQKPDDPLNENEIKMKNNNNRSRRSSSSEKAKEIEAINGLVSEKNVLITGGASGLGCAFLNHFLKHGASKITILDIDADAGRKVELSVKKSYGEKVHFIHVDVSDYQQTAEAFEKAAKLMNDIDIVINNAGILDERRWEREIAVNIGGMVSTAFLAVKYLNRNELGHGGTLVNVSQHIDIRCTAQLPVYTATKHAIIGLSQSLAESYRYEKTGIRVITLCPGLTETALTVDSPNKLLSRVMKADFVKNLEQLSIQTPYVVAQGLMSILRIGESGSIWVVENGRSPYEVYVPNPRTLRRTYKNNFTLVESKVTARGRPIREVCDNTRTGLMSCA
ncbi:uncharacterized protein LOC117607060 [Osmia lignaria lignaria]|uniref:uncharacterized protein LOC117607060 n=1 Tax=Osmia lignaria lignaria TaxID=1437193 RepID=UPI00402BB565